MAPATGLRWNILPRCILFATIPSSGDCIVPSTIYVYPGVCVFLGVVWIARGVWLKRFLAQAAQSPPLLPTVVTGMSAPTPTPVVHATAVASTPISGAK